MTIRHNYNEKYESLDVLGTGGYGKVSFKEKWKIV